MKALVLIMITFCSVFASASENRVSLAIEKAVVNQYPNSSSIQKGWVGVLTSIGNMAMIVQAPLSTVFGNGVRDFEVMYTTSFTVGTTRMECLALVKARTRSANSFKVLVSHCGQAGEIALFSNGPDNGPKFLKQVVFADDNRVTEVLSLNINNY